MFKLQDQQVNLIDHFLKLTRVPKTVVDAEELTSYPNTYAAIFDIHVDNIIRRFSLRNYRYMHEVAGNSNYKFGVIAIFFEKLWYLLFSAELTGYKQK